MKRPRHARAAFSSFQACFSKAMPSISCLVHAGGSRHVSPAARFFRFARTGR
jgi:hypothetical protein